MIEPNLVRRVSAMTLSLAAAGAAIAFAAGSARVAGGVGAGAALGLLPIVTWSVLGGLLLAGRAPLLFGVLSLGKLMIYGAALAILIGNNLVHPLAFGLALLAPSLILAVAASRRDRVPARVA